MLPLAGAATWIRPGLRLTIGSFTYRWPASVWCVMAQGLISAGDPVAMAAQFLAVLWGGLLIQLLLRVRDAPTPDEIASRARAATDVLLALYPPPRADD